MDIDSALVARLLAAQFPQHASLSITPVEPGGVDNRTFRLGRTMSVRLPSAEMYAAQVQKEHRWLPVLAAHLPLPIPAPLELGVPGQGYPWSWSVYRWLDGAPATTAPIDDLPGFATALADFLAALQRIDPTDGPPPGPHNFLRGGPLETYDTETRETVSALAGHVDAAAVTAVWDAAMAARWHGPPVWFHGDVAAGNLLVRDGRLGAVIDFGCMGVGDPAYDLAIAWTLLRGSSRDGFRRTLSPDAATWSRGRGWALWKALITLAQHRATDPTQAAEAARVIDEVIGDHAG